MDLWDLGKDVLATGKVNKLAQTQVVFRAKVLIPKIHPNTMRIGIEIRQFFMMCCDGIWMIAMKCFMQNFFLIKQLGIR